MGERSNGKMKIFHAGLLTVAVCLCVSGIGFPEDKIAAQKAALSSLAGVESYSVKSPYSQAIDEIYLGYGKDGKPKIGAALRKFKTYKVVYALLAVEEQNGKFVVTKSDIPDISLITGKDKQDKVLKAASDFSGKVVKEPPGKMVRVDAVTGATRYYSAIYATFNLMAEKIVEEMEKNPPWERKKLN
jgi:hypothetical protein